MEENEKYLKAKKHVEEIKAFYIHLVIYLVINAGLALLNIYTSPENYWFFWPLIGWGIGLFFHALGVFGPSMFFGKKWEEKKIRKFMEKN